MIRYIIFIGILLILFACNSNSKKSSDYVAMDGAKVYKLYCVSCHGTDGAMGFSGAPNLQKSVLSIDERILIITQGKGVMNAFKGILNQEEIENVAEYIETLRN